MEGLQCQEAGISQACCNRQDALRTEHGGRAIWVVCRKGSTNLQTCWSGQPSFVRRGCSMPGLACAHPACKDGRRFVQAIRAS